MNATPIVPIPRQNLTADTWAEAALDVIAAGGIEAVAVEPLARQLGVTKGSFYWHFANREALILASLNLWEKHETDDLINRAEQETTPRERVHSLLRQAANTDLRSERILLALSASESPVARASVQRVSERVRTYVQDCYRALGCDEAEARHWATFAFSTYIGTVRMRRENPDALPSGQAFNEYLRFLIKSLIPRADHGEETVAVAHPAVVPLRKAG